MSDHTLTLTAADAATFTATGRVVLVDAVYPDCTHSGPCDFPGACSGTPDPAPPAEWTALSGVCERCRTEGDPDDYEDGWDIWIKTTHGHSWVPGLHGSSTCRECGLAKYEPVHKDDGESVVMVHGETGERQVSVAPNWNSEPCPSCGGTGHPLVMVVTACDGCNGLGWVRLAATLFFRSREVVCDRCKNASGTVTLGTATAEVVPIVDGHYNSPDADHQGDHLCVIPHNGKAFMVRDGYLDIAPPIDIGPDPVSKVGQYALIVEKHNG